MSENLSQPISRKIWEQKYRYRERDEICDATIEDTWHRVASALAAVEKPGCADDWAARFYALLQDFKFLPGGRILAGAGTSHRVTLFNCFVMGGIEDSMPGIFDALKESALTMQQGAGSASIFPPCGRVAWRRSRWALWPAVRFPSCASGTACAAPYFQPEHGVAP